MVDTLWALVLPLTYNQEILDTGKEALRKCPSSETYLNGAFRQQLKSTRKPLTSGQPLRRPIRSSLKGRRQIVCSPVVGEGEEVVCPGVRPLVLGPAEDVQREAGRVSDEEQRRGVHDETHLHGNDLIKSRAVTSSGCGGSAFVRRRALLNSAEGDRRSRERENISRNRVIAKRGLCQGGDEMEQLTCCFQNRVKH